MGQSIALAGDGGRAALKAGGLSVSAPDRMTLIDESFARPAKFFDGIDRPSRVLYLLTLLKERDWAKITSTGISANDLSGEARAVMESILPHPFRWSEWKLGSRTGTGALDESQRDRVRLKLVRGLSFLVNLAGQPKSFTVVSTSGQPTPESELRFEDDGANPFGIQPMKVVPNRPKESELDYKDPSLDKPVDLPSSATLEELVDRASHATGIEVHCDFRVGSRRIACTGASCRAGDLLEGLALCVTGTYRRVGPAYELASDLEGIGARKVKFAIWEAEAIGEIQKRARDWRFDVGQSGHLAQIAFPAGCPFAPNAAMQAALSRSDRALSADMIPTADMTPWVRDFLQQVNVNRPDRPIETSRAGLQAELDCVFVLPDGREVGPEPWLQSPAAYAMAQPAPDRVKVASPPYSMSTLCSDASARSAVIQAPNAASARWQVDMLHRFGFREAWIEATRPEAVSAAADQAAKDGLRLRLLVRPWALPDDFRADDEDVTILGDRGDQLALRERQLDSWPAFCQEVGEPLEQPYRMISPESDLNYSRWAIVARLARTPGLYGLVLEGVEPFGYEGRRTDSWHSYLEKPLGEMSDFGYSPKQRLEFLRAHSLDPIDTVGDRLNLHSDLRQPFFPDDPFDSTHGGPLKALIQAWDRQRAEACRQSLQGLLDSLPNDLPGGTLISPQRSTINDRAGWDVRFCDGSTKYRQVYRFQTGQNLELAAAGLFSSLSTKGPVCLDFRGVGMSDLASVLDRYFMQVVSIKVIQIDR